MIDAKTTLHWLAPRIGMLKAMIGMKDAVKGENFVAFKFMRSRGINAVSITLTPLDLYDVEFASNTPKKGWVTKSLHENVYGENLKELFEKETGLYLSL